MATQEVAKYLRFLLCSMIWRGLNLRDKTIQHTIFTNLHFCTDQSIADSAEENARIVFEGVIIISLQLSV